MRALGSGCRSLASLPLHRGLLLAALLILLAALTLPTGTPAAAADPRYFPATGFRISSDAFWNYFQRRGGLRTFGYPVSREFTLLGSTVQIFQRQVMQRRPDGSVGLLNLLDPGLMPYTRINNASLPAFDPTVTAGAPTPGSPDYDQAVIPFIRERAPDRWLGHPVNFYATFLATVALDEAYPHGEGSAALLPYLALEIWGLPTSHPTVDPANSSFIYLRFQRGVMHYDATTGVTQGILLADYLKAILTGEGLPADLEREARASPLYKQYARTAPRWMSRPDALPGTDLTRAFEPEAPPSPAASATATPRAGAPRPQETSSIANERLHLSLGIGGPEHGQLTIRSRSGDLRAWTVPTLGLKNGARLSLKDDTVADGARSRSLPFSDPFLGEGHQLEAELPLKSGGSVTLLATLYAGKSALTVQLAVRGLAGGHAVTSFRLFDGEHLGWIDLGPATTYLTDDGNLRRGAVADGHVTGEAHAGKPLLLNDPVRKRAAVLATLDAVDHAVTFQLRPTNEPAGIRLGYEITLPPQGPTAEALSPRLFIDFTPSDDPNIMLSGYRRTIAALYPNPPLPSWVRYQWLAARALGNDLNEAALRQHIDFIAAALADLGPWQIVIEHGWLRVDDSGRTVDRTRFPSGMRALVDYAHLRGIRVVLGVPGPLLDSGAAAHAALRPLVDQQPAWFIPLATASEKRLFDFSNPAVRAWWAELVRDIVVTYDADGIWIDGYGETLAAVAKERPRPSLQAAELYRLTAEHAWAAKPNAYIEAGWYVPPFANPYVHAVRFADQAPAFDRAAPRAGLRQHFDYALFQRIALNQRPHLGAAAEGDGDAASLRFRWIETALAVGGMTGLGFPLTRLEEPAVAQLRRWLVHLRPFAGQTAFSFGTNAEVVATRVEGLTYLAFINRSASRRTITAKLTDFGLQHRPAVVRDTGTGTTFLADTAIAADLPPASLKLFIVRQEAGWLWTASAVTGEAAPGVLRYQLRGPASVPGSIEIAAPPPTRVLLAGEPLPASAFTYDARVGILRLTYTHEHARELRVEYAAGALLPQRQR
ncbi:MAG: putative glycoside hydrolase [Chloroflexota bacterium]|nr:putative glycoside hydrolase [Dehalococcoidia bacterium]MDW8252768.1 putative glycoside hydrolase [Chloroflexota bacterium]